METGLTVPTWQDRALSLVLNSVASGNTRRAYSQALARFFAWCEDRQAAFTRETVLAYRAYLLDEGIKPQSMNVHLSAIRALAREAQWNGLLSFEHGAGIIAVKGEKRLGARTGNWLTLVQARELLRKPDPQTLKGMRDRCLLALLIGCGLRREEAVVIEVEQVQQREDRWVLVDVLGKGRRTRTVPVPEFAVDMIWNWVWAAKINTGKLLRRVYQTVFISAAGIGPEAVHKIVAAYGRECGYEIGPHDLRRTFATLSLKGGAGMRDIQEALGHTSVVTTEKYLQATKSVSKGAGDWIKLRREDMV